jgi:hypothetical protein
MAAIEPEPPSNTFMSEVGFTSSTRLLDDREFFMSKLRNELRPEHDSTSTHVEVTGTPLVDLVPSDVEAYESSTLEVRKGQQGRMYITVAMGERSLTAMICETASGHLVCVNDTVLPLDNFSRLSSISKLADGTLQAYHSAITGVAYIFRNTSVPLLLLTIQACKSLSLTESL